MEKEMRRLFVENSPDRRAAKKIFPIVWAARRESTLKTYKPSFLRVDRFLKRRNIKFEKMSEDTALEFLMEEDEAGASPARLRQDSACVAMMAELSRTENVLGGKLAAKVKTGLAARAIERTKRITRRPATPEDVSCLLLWHDSPEATKLDRMMCVAFALAFVSQKRVGDIAGLRWKDVTFTGKDVVLKLVDHKTVKHTGRTP